MSHTHVFHPQTKASSELTPLKTLVLFLPLRSNSRPSSSGFRLPATSSPATSSPSTSQESARRTRLGRLGAARHVGLGPCAAGARSSPAVVKPNSLFPGHLQGTSQAILLEVARLRRAPPPQPTAPRAASVASISFTTFSKLKVTKLLPFLSLHLSLQAHRH